VFEKYWTRQESRRAVSCTKVSAEAVARGDIRYLVENCKFDEVTRECYANLCLRAYTKDEFKSHATTGYFAPVAA
jgi:hypothetical protein